MNDHVIRASNLAARHHHGQFRKHSVGVPYIVHPARVAAGLPGELLQMAGWCHDLLEDTDCPPAEIEAVCGAAVLSLVRELTNPSKAYEGLSRAERKAMDREHARSMSSEAKRVKGVDRLDNLREAALTCADVDWLRMYAQESVLLAEAIHPYGEGARMKALQILNGLKETP